MQRGLCELVRLTLQGLGAIQGCSTRCHDFLGFSLHKLVLVMAGLALITGLLHMSKHLVDRYSEVLSMCKHFHTW